MNPSGGFDFSGYSSKIISWNYFLLPYPDFCRQTSSFTESTTKKPCNDACDQAFLEMFFPKTLTFPFFVFLWKREKKKL
jgi:hypothetical protein